jgi:hypothetical protein
MVKLLDFRPQGAIDLAVAGSGGFRLGLTQYYKRRQYLAV